MMRAGLDSRTLHISCSSYTATYERSSSTLSPVSTGMGDHLRAGIPPRYVTKPTRSTQPCIPPGSLNRVPALVSWGKGGNVTSAGWQVTLCDPIGHVSSCSDEAVCKLLYLCFTLLYFTLHIHIQLFNGSLSGTTRVSSTRRNIHHSFGGAYGVICHLLGFMCKGKITEADAPTSGWMPSHLDYRCPTSIIPPFYTGCPSCRNPPNLSWLETGTKYAVLHTQWQPYSKMY